MSGFLNSSANFKSNYFFFNVLTGVCFIAFGGIAFFGAAFFAVVAFGATTGCFFTTFFLSGIANTGVTDDVAAKAGATDRTIISEAIAAATFFNMILVPV